MSTLAVIPETRLARPLKALVPLIKQDIQQGHEAGLEYYRAAGEKLQEAKSQLRRGEWGKWLAANFSLSQDTARNYMNLAGEIEIRDAISEPARSSQAREFKTLSEFTSPGRGSHQPIWHQPVKEVLDNLNVPRMKQERQEKEKEEQLQHQLGLKLVDIGYRALAAKLHPDKGGSQEAMIRLQAVRDRLKGAI